MMQIGMLTESGKGRFSEYLRAISSGAVLPIPRNLLSEEPFSQPLPDKTDIETKKLVSRMEAAEYLHSSLGKVDQQYVDGNSGLWSWLALYFFEQLCPPSSEGHHTPGAEYRYILPEASSEDFFRHYYRHLLYGPYRIYRLHSSSPHKGRLLLCQNVDSPGDFSEQLASRMELVTNKSVFSAADQLYYDVIRNQPKRGATNRDNPGNLRRFIDILQQLDVTYDLYGLSGEQIVSLLPNEFSRWRSSTSENSSPDRV